MCAMYNLRREETSCRFLQPSIVGSRATVWNYRVGDISNGEECQTFCTFLVGTTVYSSACRDTVNNTKLSNFIGTYNTTQLHKEFYTMIQMYLLSPMSSPDDQVPT